MEIFSSIGRAFYKNAQIFTTVRLALALFLELREKVSKILRTWNLGGQQIVSGPIFSDSPYKNRLVANFSALEDLF
jgi:hypothetical protein